MDMWPQHGKGLDPAWNFECWGTEKSRAVSNSDFFLKAATAVKILLEKQQYQETAEYHCSGKC